MTQRSTTVAALVAMICLATSYSATAVDAHDVIMSEIAWMGTTNDANDEWLELFNNTAADINLNGWRLASQDASPSILLTGTIPAGGHYLLERTDDTTTPQFADQIYAGALNNTGEVLTLTDNLSNVIDVVGTLGSGWFAGNNTTKATMVRMALLGEGTQATSWGDGSVNGSPANSQIDRDGDGYTWSPNLRYPGWDCDDTRNTIHPDAPETLNLRDDDCDGQVDDGLDLGPLSITPYFNSDRILTATGVTLAPTSMELALISLIDTTTSTLDIALYDFTRQSLADALLRARGRGVTLRVVADDETFASQPLYQSLVLSGTTVVTDGRPSSLQHNKFAVSDRQRVWTGSVNWSGTDLTYNANNAVLITAAHVAQAYTTEFEEMFVGRRFSITKANDTTHVFSYSNALTGLYFSPSDGVEAQIVSALNGAQAEVHFATFFFTSDVLATALISATQRGVTVTGVMDALGAASAGSEDGRLCSAGIPVKIETFGGKLHDTFAVVDPFGADPVLVLGSHNWTASADNANDENTLIVHSAELAQAYYAEFQRLYDALPASTICASVPAESGLYACIDGIDNDFDGLIDMQETSCQATVWSIFVPAIQP